MTDKILIERSVVEQVLEGLIMGFAMYPNGGDYPRGNCCSHQRTPSITEAAANRAGACGMDQPKRTGMDHARIREGCKADSQSAAGI